MMLQKGGLIGAALASCMAITGFAPVVPQARGQETQSTFASPDDAVKALKDAAQAKDRDAMRKVFGPALKDLCSGDETQDKADLLEFARRLAEQCKVVPNGDDRATLEIGREAHPFAIPLSRKDGKWFFDTEAGKEELLNRRIGENELGAIRVCRGYVVAQYEYFSADRDGDDVIEFAQKLLSTPGKQDGLFWETKPDEPPSPLGPAVAEARAEGYLTGDAKPGAPRPYHGYIYKILRKQGRGSPGGAFDYVINDNMVAGFALLAYPIDWQSSGVMTFQVNSNGKVFQKDLGEKTTELAGNMDAYEIDPTWTVAKD
jgi:hypothetical protein